MTEQSNPSVKISIDLKKYRIRLHKSTLHILGDPPYVQLLVNPSAGVVALRAVAHYSSGDSLHRVSKKQLLSTNSVEIYSMSLVQTLMQVVPDLSEGRLYRMVGSLVPAEKLAVFSFDTLKECSEVEA